MGPCGLGVTGVLLGTTASILIMISFDPYLIYKKVFKKSSIPYYLSYIGYLALIVATGALVSLICAQFSEYNVLHCLIRLAICLIVPERRVVYSVPQKPVVSFFVGQDVQTAWLGQAEGF